MSSGWLRPFSTQFINRNPLWFPFLTQACLSVTSPRCLASHAPFCLPEPTLVRKWLWHLRAPSWSQADPVCIRGNGAIPLVPAGPTHAYSSESLAFPFIPWGTEEPGQ